MPVHWLKVLVLTVSHPIPMVSFHQRAVTDSLPGFDNESVAISAMCCSFFFWCRALRSPKSWPIAGLAGHLGVVVGVALGEMA